MVSLLKQTPAPCGCKPEDTTTTNGVTVKGHGKGCTLATPRIYRWLDDRMTPGSGVTGTLAEYSERWHQSFGGTRPFPSFSVRAQSGVLVKPVIDVVACLKNDGTGTMGIRLSVDNEHVVRSFTR